MTDQTTPKIVATFAPSPADQQPLRALRGCDVYGPGSKTGLSRSEIYRQIADGTFPPGFMIARNCRAWFEHTIDHWLLERAKRASADNVDEKLIKARAARKAGAK